MVNFKTLDELTGNSSGGGGDEPRKLLVVEDYRDKRAESAIENVKDSLLMPDGEVFHHVLADRLVSYMHKWEGRQQGEMVGLFEEAEELIPWASDMRYVFLESGPTDNINAMATQATMNFGRSLHIFCQVASDYIDVPSFYGRPKVVEMRVCRALGGLFDIGDHIHQGTGIKNSISSISRIDYFSQDDPDPRAFPYFPCRRSDELSVQSIANLLGTTVDWVNRSVTATVAEMGEEMMKRDISHEDVLAVFGR